MHTCNLTYHRLVLTLVLLAFMAGRAGNMFAGSLPVKAHAEGKANKKESRHTHEYQLTAADGTHFQQGVIKFGGIALPLFSFTLPLPGPVKVLVKPIHRLRHSYFLAIFRATIRANAP